MNPTQTDIVNPTLSLDPATGLTETLRTASARHGERAILLCSFQKEESVILDELVRVSGSEISIASMRSWTASLSPIELVIPSLQESVPGHETTSVISRGPGSPRPSSDSARQTS